MRVLKARRPIMFRAVISVTVSHMDTGAFADAHVHVSQACVNPQCTQAVEHLLLTKAVKVSCCDWFTQQEPPLQ